MAAHTPGPWAITYAQTSARWPIVCSDDERGIEVAELSGVVAERLGVRWFSDPNAPEIEANARLIAAAPDLLAALKALFVAVDGNPGALSTVDAVIAAKAAIAKAEAR